MKNLYSLFVFAFLAFIFNVRATDVTFQVQMDEAPAEGVWIWIPNYGDLWEEMLDEDSDLVYTYTVSDIDPGTQLWYSYWVSWEEGEEVPPESRFHEANFRFFIVPVDNYTIPVVGYGQNHDPLPEKVNVTFKVELGGDSVLTNGMWMVNKNPWQWEEMMSVGNDVFEKTWQPFKDQMMYFTFVYGGQDNWEGEESVPEECNYGTPSAPERLFEGASSDSVLPVIPFGGCITTVDFTKITFQVNMSQVSMNEGDIVWAYINNDGSWPELSDENEDDIYSAELNFEPGTVLQYFYAYGTWDIWDEEIVPEDCADNEGYRTFTVGDDDTVLPAYLYGTCDTGTGGIGEQSEAFTISPNPANEHVSIHLLQKFGNSHITFSDMSGKRIKKISTHGESIIQIDLNEFKPGIYIIRLNTLNGDFHHKVVVTH